MELRRRRAIGDLNTRQHKGQENCLCTCVRSAVWQCVGCRLDFSLSLSLCPSMSLSFSLHGRHQQACSCSAAGEQTSVRRRTAYSEQRVHGRHQHQPQSQHQ